MSSSNRSAELRTAVVVVNWNRAALTIRSVRALQSDLPDATAIVVVDNGSDDGSADDLATALPGVRVVRRTTNGGFAAGVNAGIRAAGDAEAIVLMNNDAVPRPGFVAALVDAIRAADDDVAAVTARIELADRWRLADRAGVTDGALVDHAGRRWVRAPDGDVRLNSTGVLVDRSGNGRDRDWFAPADTLAHEDVFGFSGGAAVLRRAALDDVGPMDESLFMYYEDTELAWRFARRGWRVRYAAGAVVEHDHSGSSGVASELFLFRNPRNRLLVALWHAPAPVVGRAFVRTAVRGARLAMTSGTAREGRITLRALADVLRGLPRHLRHRARLARRASVPRASVRTEP